MRKQVCSLIFLLLICMHLQALELRDQNGDLKPAAKQFLALFDVPEGLSCEQLNSYLSDHWIQQEHERWLMERRFEDKQEAALPLLKELGCIETIHASQQQYDYALVIGATGKTMQYRLDFLYEQWQRGIRFNQIVLLTGQRDLVPERETYPEGMQTEAELFAYLFENHPLFGLVPHIVIDSPKDSLGRRPSTVNTASDWMASCPKPGSCLAVSTQPFVGYHEAVLRAYIPSHFSVECIGPTAYDIRNFPNAMAILLDNFAKWHLYESIRHHEN